MSDPKITLKKLTLTNFKGFESAEIHFSDLTVLSGANATGKSNVREALRFLHGVGLGYSLPEIFGERYEGGQRVWSGIRGGFREAVFSGAREDQKLDIEQGLPASKGVIMRHEVFIISVEIELESLHTVELIQYTIAVTSGFQANTQKTVQIGDARIAFETLIHNGISLYEAHSSDSGFYNFARFYMQNDFVEFGHSDVVNDDAVSLNWNFYRPILPQVIDKTMNMSHIPENFLQAETVNWFNNTNKIGRLLRDFLLSVYFPRFDLQLLRSATFPTDRPLSESGNNLSGVLHFIHDQPHIKQTIAWLLQQMTPLDGVDLKFFTDDVGQVRVQLEEIDGSRISVFSVSDGTLRLLALIATLYHPNPPQFIFFEEIENGIHPARQYLLLDMIDERIKRAGIQIVTTTHSPSLLGYLNVAQRDDLHILYRLEGERSARIKRFQDIPHAQEIADTQGIARLLGTDWFETVLQFDHVDENKTVEVAGVN